MNSIQLTMLRASGQISDPAEDISASARTLWSALRRKVENQLRRDDLLPVGSVGVVCKLRLHAIDPVEIHRAPFHLEISVANAAAGNDHNANVEPRENEGSQREATAAQSMTATAPQSSTRKEKGSGSDSNEGNKQCPSKDGARNVAARRGRSSPKKGLKECCKRN